MDSVTSTIVVVLLLLLLFLFLFLVVTSMRAAYRNGVRDGYQNTWLPHVQDQVKAEKLDQGEEVRL